MAEQDPWRAEVNDSLKGLSRSVQEISRNMCTRKDLEQMIATRVDKDVYHPRIQTLEEDIHDLKESKVDKAIFETRLKALEQRPEDTRANIGAVVAIISVLINVVLLAHAFWH